MAKPNGLANQKFCYIQMLPNIEKNATMNFFGQGLLSHKLNLQYNTEKKSVQKAGVAFVKEASERNEFFEKNKQAAMYDKQVRTNKTKD